jgi:beta-glucanase (GH16 family)
VQYGRIEARMKLPVGAGLWPAFWMLGTNIGSVGWPTCGEQDIMEWVPQYTPTTTSSHIHGPGYSGANGIGANFTFPNGGRVDDAGYHTYGLIWSVNKLQFYRDDYTKPFLTLTPANIPSGTQWVYNQPFFILLNLAVGGNFPGNPTSSTPNPAIVLVDYVRVYQLQNIVATPVFSPGGGSYTSAQSVTISDSTNGASIRYTTDGSTPTPTTGTLYSGAVNISSTATLKAIAYASGMSNSAVASTTYTIGSGGGTCVTATVGGGWQNSVMTSETGTFTATFDATPSAAPTNSVVGLSNGAQTAYANFACLVRFNTSGDIDARNGGAYAAASTIHYSAGVAYHFRLVVNIGTQTYSIYVTPAGGSELTVGLNYAFRIADTTLNWYGVFVDAAASGGAGSDSVCNFSAGGTITTYAISASAGSGGSISPTGTVTVNAGASQTFTITPNSGFTISSVTVDGVNQGAITSFTFSNVQANHTISAAFSQITFAIAASASSGGSISPTGTVTVNAGASQSFTITPNSGFSISGVTVDGANQGAITTYTFSNVQANHTINAAFTPPQQFTITASAGSGGSISPTGSVVVNQGANQSFSIAANSGFTISSVTVDGVNQGAITSFTFSNVQANHTISAAFAASNRTLTGSSGNGWHALAISPAATGTFTAIYDATPSVSPENAVVGLSNGAATAFGNLGCIARFNPSGDIDAYNGTAYAAAATIPYSANVSYHFRLVVNVTAHTYSVFVTPAGGSELTVGSNYAFRSTANTMTSLNDWNLFVDSSIGGASLTANNLAP